MFSKTKHAAVVIASRAIREEWINHALANFVEESQDRNDTDLQHYLAPIEEYDSRVLRVIVKKGTIPPLVITAFFDRSMKGKL
jgi:hypothetical protein